MMTADQLDQLVQALTALDGPAGAPRARAGITRIAAR